MVFISELGSAHFRKGKRDMWRKNMATAIEYGVIAALIAVAAIAVAHKVGETASDERRIRENRASITACLLTPSPCENGFVANTSTGEVWKIVPDQDLGEQYVSEQELRLGMNNFEWLSRVKLVLPGDDNYHKWKQTFCFLHPKDALCR